jgi:hypothetical protein
LYFVPGASYVYPAPTVLIDISYSTGITEAGARWRAKSPIAKALVIANQEIGYV